MRTNQQFTIQTNSVLTLELIKSFERFIDAIDTERLRYRYLEMFMTAYVNESIDMVNAEDRNDLFILWDFLEKINQ